MKTIKFISGVFITLLIIASATFGILSLRGIHIIDWTIIVKILISGGVVAVSIFILWIVSALFFKKGI